MRAPPAPELPPLPLRIGFDRRRVFRSVVVLFALGTVAAVLFTLVQQARPSALGGLLLSRGVGPMPLSFLLVEGLTLLVVVLALAGAWRRRDFVVLGEKGLEFQSESYGTFLVEWRNVAAFERVPAGYVGIRLRDRSRPIATHQGSAEQRERLATRESVSSYDLILHPEELSCGVDRFLAWGDAVRSRAPSH